MIVQVTPSLAVTMLDALPYLVDYPYGCTEQTLSRFLPAVVTAKTLDDLDLSAEDTVGRLFGGVEPSTSRDPPRRLPGPAELDSRIAGAWPGSTTSSTPTAAGAGGRRRATPT